MNARPVTVYIAEQLSPVDEECSYCREVISNGDYYIRVGTEPDGADPAGNDLCRWCSQRLPETCAKPL